MMFLPLQIARPYRNENEVQYDVHNNCIGGTHTSHSLKTTLVLHNGICDL